MAPIPRVLKSLADRPPGKPICFDLRRLDWATPSLMTFICACSRALEAQGTSMLLDIDENCAVFPYLQRMDFFEACGIPTVERFRRHAPGTRFVELQRVSSISSGGLSHEKLAHASAVAVAGDEDYLNTVGFLEYCVGELLNNLRQHAGADGFVCAQFYEKMDLVRLSVCDAGVGIRASLQRNPRFLSLDDDERALELAIQPNVTGNPPSAAPYSNTQNTGNGLYFLAQLVRKSKGRMWLCSGAALLIQDPEGAVAVQRTSPLMGTFVEMQIQRRLLADYDRTMDEIRRERFGTRTVPVQFE